MLIYFLCLYQVWDALKLAILLKVKSQGSGTSSRAQAAGPSLDSQ